MPKSLTPTVIADSCHWRQYIVHLSLFNVMSSCHTSLFMTSRRATIDFDIAFTLTANQQ